MRKALGDIATTGGIGLTDSDITRDGWDGYTQTDGEEGITDTQGVIG